MVYIALLAEPQVLGLVWSETEATHHMPSRPAMIFV